IGKVAALYIRDFEDPVAVSAVNEVESLTTALARKVWQKLVVIHSPLPATPHMGALQSDKSEAKHKS
ncbi:MAG: hypothetical protein JW808_05430, partial [Victivallales bacterium]|nr:hypothetical protein [Victivallales bacterium]